MDPADTVVSRSVESRNLLNELTGMVTTLSLDPNAGTLKELDSVLCCRAVSPPWPACRVV
jgi:hypothetical protein